MSKKVKIFLIVLVSMIGVGIFSYFYLLNFYLPSMTPLYHYQEGVVFFEQEGDEIQYSQEDQTKDFFVDIYENGWYRVCTLKKGTELVDHTSIGKLSQADLDEIQDTFQAEEFETLPEFIFNGYVDGKGYELILYEDGKEKKTVQGFHLTATDMNDFDELQTENYQDTLQAEIQFVTIKNSIVEKTGGAE